MPRRYSLVIPLIAGVVLIGGIFFYFILHKNSRHQTFQNFINSAAYQEALEKHHSGDLDAGIKAFTDLANNAPSQDAAVQAKLKVASDLFFRNRGDDRAQAIQMYKKIISDVSVIPLQRAIAISDLMDLYNGTQDKSFARKMLFSGEPFGRFLNEADAAGYVKDKEDIEYAMRRAYEVADTLYPLSLVEFRIANWYAIALDDNLSKNDKEKQEFIQSLKEWTLKAESNLHSTLRLGYEKSKVGYIYQMDGMTRISIAKYVDDKASYQLAERSFMNGLQAFAPEDSEAHTVNFGMYLRFQYAAMLADVYGGTRKKDIENILRPIIEGPPAKFQGYPFSFFEFLKNETRRKKDILRLIKLVPEFKQVFEMRGIRYL